MVHKGGGALRLQARIWREAQQRFHSQIVIREHEGVHAPYYPWVEALSVGSLDMGRSLTPESLLRTGGHFPARFRPVTRESPFRIRRRRPFPRFRSAGRFRPARHFQRGSSGFWGYPPRIALHGEAVRVRERNGMLWNAARNPCGNTARVKTTQQLRTWTTYITRPAGAAFTYSWYCMWHLFVCDAASTRATQTPTHSPPRSRRRDIFYRTV